MGCTVSTNRPANGRDAAAARGDVGTPAAGATDSEDATTTFTTALNPQEMTIQAPSPTMKGGDSSAYDTKPIVAVHATGHRASSDATARRDEQQQNLLAAEDDLSDISDSDSHPAAGDAPPFCGDRSGQFARVAAAGSGTVLGGNLQREREAAVPSVEEEFFEYDDIKIATDVIKSTKWRLQGRKPAVVPAAVGGSGLPSPGGSGRRDSGASKSLLSAGGKGKFIWADFTVDEIDMVDSLTSTGPALRIQSQSAEGAKDQGVPSSVNARHQRLMEESNRPIRRKGSDGAEVKRTALTHLLGHASRVKCIAISPSEKEFVSCSNEDASITLCNAVTGREIGIFTGHQDTVINATFSHDGKYLATTSRDHTMVLWDVVTAKQLLTFDHAKVVICCVFSKDSKFVATGCQDKVCRLWETRKGRECLIFSQHEGIIICMSYSPDNLHIVSASADKTLRVWSTTTAKCRYTLTGHQGIVLACHYTNNGKHIVSNDEKLVKVWNTSDGSCSLTLVVDDVSHRLRHTPVGAKKLTWTLSCAAPGEFTTNFIVACNNRFVYLLDVETGEEVSNVFCKAPVYCLAAGYAHMAAFGDSFGNIYLWKLF